MNKKLSRLFQPGLQFYFLLLILFAVATFFYVPQAGILAAVEAGVIVLPMFTQNTPAKNAAASF
jgi:hypothetical protein